MTGAADVERVLRGTMLEGRPVRSKGLGSSGELAFELPLEEGGLDEWRAARAVCEQLGRWPLLSPDWDYGTWGRSPVEPHEPTATVIQRARARPWPDNVPLAVVGPEDWAGWVAGDIENTRYAYHDGPDHADVLARVPRPDRLALERVVFEWEERARPTVGAQLPRVFDSPGTLSDEDLLLVLLPLPEPWMLPGYVEIYMAGYDYGPRLGRIGVERLAAAMKSWQERYGAEPCAVGALTLRFDVRRPPTDITDAFQLAGELDHFNRTQGSIREFARDLLGSHVWELCDRP